jgi:signal transduction histidine kinase
MQAPLDGRSKATVLVADDEDIGRSLMCAWLARDYEVVEAASGEEAIAAVAVSEPDVVLLDVRMPGMGGIEACRALKARPGAGYLPVILLTAFGEPEMRNAGLEAGADDFLTRPLDKRELLLRVRAFQRLRAQDHVIRGQVRELRELDVLKNDLISLVTHDLRNALGGVMLLLESMDIAEDTGPGKGQMTILRTATERMHETLDDMLRIKRLEDGVLVIDRAPVRLGEVVGAAIALALPAANARGVTVVEHVDPAVTVSVDARLLVRAVFNLLQNAVKFSDRGAQVDVEAVAVAGFVLFRVLDRGPGVPDDLADRLFDKFTTRADYYGRKGLGLGLYFVRLAAGAHGGRAVVGPRTGGGAVFELTVACGMDADRGGA